MKATSVTTSRLTEVTCHPRSAAVSRILCSTARPGEREMRKRRRERDREIDETEGEVGERERSGEKDY